MKINKFNRTACGTIREAMEKAAQEIADQFGLAVTVKGGTFADDHYTPKIEFAVIGDNGQAMTREASALVESAGFLGLPDNPIGLIFSVNGQRYKLAGYKPNSPKYPFIADSVASGKSYKFTRKAVLTAILSA